MQFQEPIAVGSLKVRHRSDAVAGGRWFHLACLPGGFRADDVVESDDAEQNPAVVRVLAEHNGRSGVEASDHNVDSGSATALPLSAPIALPAQASQDQPNHDADLLLSEDNLDLFCEARCPPCRLFLSI